ncbi:hypothetical protein AB4344_11720 [Vibrio breoganii]
MAYLNPRYLTMLDNTDIRRLNSSPTKLVPIIGPIYGSTPPKQLLCYCAAGMQYAHDNGKLESVNFNTMTIALNNNDMIEQWLCCALYSATKGKKDIVLMFIGSMPVPKQ